VRSTGVGRRPAETHRNGDAAVRGFGLDAGITQTLTGNRAFHRGRCGERCAVERRNALCSLRPTGCPIDQTDTRMRSDSKSIVGNHLGVFTQNIMVNDFQQQNARAATGRETARGNQ
jgi:hypothetical protein